MKIPKRSFVVILMMWAALIVALPQMVCAVEQDKPKPAEKKYTNEEVHRIETEIAEYRDRIIEEGKAIAADRKRSREASRLADKTKAEQMKQEMQQDIKNREAAINGLKREINDRKDRKNEILYGKTQGAPKRVREK